MKTLLQEKKMSTAPLNRDQQIRFMKEASARREAAFKRWSQDETLNGLFRAPAKPISDHWRCVRTEILTLKYG